MGIREDPQVVRHGVGKGLCGPCGEDHLASPKCFALDVREQLRRVMQAGDIEANRLPQEVPRLCTGVTRHPRSRPKAAGRLSGDLANEQQEGIAGNEGAVKVDNERRHGWDMRDQSPGKRGFRHT
jgi:hypothetical protein